MFSSILGIFGCREREPSFELSEKQRQDLREWRKVYYSYKKLETEQPDTEGPCWHFALIGEGVLPVIKTTDEQDDSEENFDRIKRFFDNVEASITTNRMGGSLKIDKCKYGLVGLAVINIDLVQKYMEKYAQDNNTTLRELDEQFIQQSQDLPSSDEQHSGEELSSSSEHSDKELSSSSEHGDEEPSSESGWCTLQ